jgi:predicted nucleic acid-binding Zn ribbon protein
MGRTIPKGLGTDRRVAATGRFSRSMPTYVYKFVDTGETIEVQQSFDDSPLTEATHPTTGAVMPVRKVFTPVGVTFKGGGFYKTDSRGKSGGGKRKDEKSSTSADTSTSGGSSSGSSDSSSSSSSTSTSTSKDTSSATSGSRTD